MDPGAFFVIGSVIASTVWAALAGQRRRNRRREAMMRGIAATIGGEVHVAMGRIGVTGAINGIKLQFQSRDAQPWPFVEWTAYVPHGALPRFRVSSESIDFGDTAGLGCVDVSHHPAFAQRFRVRSSDPDVVLRMWTTQLMDTVLWWFPRCSVGCSGREVVLTVQGELWRADAIDAGLRLVEALANADVFGFAALRRLRAAVSLRSPDGLPAVRIAAPSDIVVGPMTLGTRLVTRARVQGLHHVDHEIVHVRDGAVSDPRNDALLTMEQRRAAATLGDVDIEWTRGQIYVTWRRLETEVAHLESGVALLRSLSAPPKLGVFR